MNSYIFINKAVILNGRYKIKDIDEFHLLFTKFIKYFCEK